MKAHIDELTAIVSDLQRASLRLKKWAGGIPQSQMLFPSQYEDAQRQIHEASSSIADFIVAYLCPKPNDI